MSKLTNLNYLTESITDQLNDEQINENELNEDDEDNFSEDEIDDETRKLIYEAQMRNFNRVEVPNIVLDKAQYIKKPKDSKHNLVSLDQFVKNTNIEAELNKPKSFVSKRVADKKNKAVCNIPKNTEYKRVFNPRLPPYNFVRVSRTMKADIILDNNDFPSL